MTIKKMPTFNFLEFVDYSKFDKWYVSYYVNPHSIESNYHLEKLESIIRPAKDKIKKKDYDGSLDIVSKISFKDGVIHLRKERKTGMDLYFTRLNQLIVSKINFHQGAIAINNIGDLACSTHYQIYEIINPNVLPTYLTLTLRSKHFQNFLEYLRADGIKNEATYDFIKELKIPLPKLEEQEKLVFIYQAKINQANELIKESQSLDNKLDQKLGITAVESDNIISGKLSFIDFDKIEQWGLDQIFKTINKYDTLYKVSSVQLLCNVGSGGTPRRSIARYYRGDIPWVKTGEVLDDIIYDTEEKITKEAVANSSAKKYPKGSLLVAMYGQGKTRGRTAKLGIEATTNQACAVLYDIKNELVLTDYLWVYLMNEYDRIRELASGNNQPNLNADMIKNYPVVLPPLSVQATIVDFYFSIKEKMKINKKEAEIFKEQSIVEFENTVFQTRE